VITDDEVTRLFEEADPARGGDDTGSFLETAGRLHVVGTMSIDGKPTETLRTVTATRRHRWRTITGVAAAILLIAVGAVVVVARNDPPLETSVAANAGASAEKAEEVARGFLDAYGAFDADRAMTFLTEHAVAAEWRTPAKFRLELMLLQASGWKQTISHPYTAAHAGDVPPPPPGRDGCEPYNFGADKKELAAGRLTVRCTYTYHGLRSDAIERGPYEGAYWAIIVDKGRIVSAENRIDTGLDGFDDEMWRPFRRWVSSAYPQDAAAMYQGNNRSGWKRSEESVRLWDQHTREFVAIGAPYIARAEAICAAAHDRLETTSDPPPTGPFDANVDAYEAYDAMSARILEEALAELRAVPPPEAFRVQFQQAYALGDNLVGLLRNEPGDALDVHAFGAQPGLGQCRMLIQGG
jgi:hypothetical protein